MRAERVLVIGVSGCVLSVIGILLTLAHFAGSEETVSVELSEQVQLDVCMLDSKEAYEGDRITGLFPGETVERKPAVILDGESPDAYIRVKICFGGILEEPEEETEEELAERLERIKDLQNGISFCDGWLEGDDGFYYYQKKVSQGSIIPVYDQVTIPKSWDNHIAEQTFSIEIYAEAVRADSLEPWFSDKEGNIEIRTWE